MRSSLWKFINDDIKEDVTETEYQVHDNSKKFQILIFIDKNIHTRKKKTNMHGTIDLTLNLGQELQLMSRVL